MNYKVIEYPSPAVQYILDVIGDDGFIAGGMARQYAYTYDVLSTKPPEPRDIDIFPARKGTVENPVKPSLNRRIRDLGYTETYTTIHSTEFHKEGLHPVQVVMPHESEFEKMYGTAEEVLSQFDFTINMFALQKRDGVYVLIYTDEAVRDNELKQLVINHVNAPIPMAHRVAKYVKKGYSIKPRQWVHIFDGWDKRPTEYRQRMLDMAITYGNEPFTFEYLFLQS